MVYRHKFSDEQREHAKDEIHAELVKCAKEKRLITYKELASSVQSLHLEQFHHLLYQLLDAVCMGEEDAGHGMLSVLVVTEADGTPSKGFFDLAESHYGYDISDKRAFFHEQREKVYAYWGKV